MMPTWKLDAEKRPRQKNCDTFTMIAQKHEVMRNISAGTLYSYL